MWSYPLTLRWAKMSLTAAAALLLSLFVVNNILDYETNFQYVAHILSMDTIAPQHPLKYRAITDVRLHHVAYCSLIAMEGMTAGCCWLGTIQLYRARQLAETFNRAKTLAMLGLTLSLLIWLVGFLAIGGEWFLMWLSPTWNAQAAAFRFLLTFGLVWLILALPDREDSNE